MVDEDHPGSRIGRDAVRTQEHLARGIEGGEAREHDVGTPGDVEWGCGRLRPEFDDRGLFGPGSVVDGQIVTGPHDMLAHGKSHSPESDETDTHARSSLSRPRPSGSVGRLSADYDTVTIV